MRLQLIIYIILYFDLGMPVDFEINELMTNKEIYRNQHFIVSAETEICDPCF